LTIPIEDIEMIPGITNKFCGSIENNANNNPFIPNSLTKKPTVKPIANPLNKIIIGIMGMPIIIIPVIHIKNIVLRLFKIDSFSNKKLSTSSLLINLKKELKKLITCPF